MDLNGKCDFCDAILGPDIKVYPAHDFIYHESPGMKLMSGADWVACPKCAAMVDGEDWSALEAWAIEAFCKAHPMIPVQFVRVEVRQLHAQFRDARFKVKK